MRLRRNCDGYYVRAFCTANATPTINNRPGILAFARFSFTPQVDDTSELDSPSWRQFELLYKVEKGQWSSNVIAMTERITVESRMR